MRERLWYELGQVKHNHLYCCHLLAKQRRQLSYFNMIVLAFSSAGVMGWTFWNTLPLISCFIVSILSLIKLLSPHFMPAERQIDKLDTVTDFYFNYLNQIEKLWLDHFNRRLTDEQTQEKFYTLKDTEREISKSVNELVKSVNKRMLAKARIETRAYLQRTFN